MWDRNTILRTAAYRDRLAHEEVTLAEMLKQAGYTTMFAGKWHLGVEGWNPADQGYDYCIGVDKVTLSHLAPYGIAALKDASDGEDLGDRLALDLMKIVDAKKSQPFFAFPLFYYVHTPLMTTDVLRDKYGVKQDRQRLPEEFGVEYPRPDASRRRTPSTRA